MKQTLFIGSYSKSGIHQVIFDDGKISNLKSNKTFENCSYLIKNNDIIYNIIEYSDNPIYENGYLIARNSNFSILNTSPLLGKGPCYLTIDTKRNLIYVANYGDGSLDVFSLKENGAIDTCIFHKPYTKHSRIHQVLLSPDNEFLFVVDLGNDTLFVYKIIYTYKNIELKEITNYSFPKNTAPRHIAIVNNNIYLVTENSCELYHLILTPQNNFKLITKLSLLPHSIKRNQDTGCAIKISNDFRFVYTSIRGHNSISVFETTPSLKLIQNIDCSGNTPRDIFLNTSQNFLLCANQESKSISIFSRDTKTGYLHFKSKYPIDSPACII